MSRRDQLFDMESACCTCLAELSYDYANGQTVIERNGIYIVAMLLFPENEDFQRLEKFNHLQVSFTFPIECLINDVYFIAYCISNIAIFVFLK